MFCYAYERYSYSRRSLLVHTCRVSKGMIVSNGDCHIPQRLEAGLNADGAAQISAASRSIISSKVGTAGAAASCKLRGPPRRLFSPSPSPSSPNVGGIRSPPASGSSCSAPALFLPRCVLMASNQPQPSAFRNPRCGCSGSWPWGEDAAPSGGQLRTRSRYADRNLVTGSRTTPILIQPLLLSLYIFSISRVLLTSKRGSCEPTASNSNEWAFDTDQWSTPFVVS